MKALRTQLLTFTFLFASSFLGFAPIAVWAAERVELTPVHQLNGEAFNWADYKGKSILIVNIATRCGYTKQLKGLQAISEKYKTKGFAVVGVPSNDFGGQTPEDDQGVKKFCENAFGVSFPLTEKLVVRGPDKHPLYKSLLAAGPNQSEIAWNFEKFLIDKNGLLRARFKSAVEPESGELTNAIEQTL